MENKRFRPRSARWVGKGGVMDGSSVALDAVAASSSDFEVGCGGMPIPRATIASFLAAMRCCRTSIAAFLFEKRICVIASSIDFPAIWRARGASFFIDVLKKWDRLRWERSVRAICMAFVRRPRRRMSLMTIRRCQRARAFGRGLRTTAIFAGLRDENGDTTSSG